MKIIAYVQADARYNKYLFEEVAGVPVIQHILARLQQISSIDQIIIGTFACAENAKLQKSLSRLHGVRVELSQEADVSLRMIDIALRYEATLVMRVTGDQIFLDTAVAQNMLNVMRQGTFDAYLTDPNDGLLPDIITGSLLIAYQKQVHRYDRYYKYVAAFADELKVKRIQDTVTHPAFRFFVRNDWELQTARMVWASGGSSCSIPANYGLEYTPCPLCGAHKTQLLGDKDHWPVVMCECGLVRIDPLPAPDWLDQWYSGSFDWNGILTQPERIRIPKRQRFNVIEPLVALKPGGHYLEVGCALGFGLKTARELGFDVHGIEFSRPMAQWACQQLDLDVFAGDLAGYSGQCGADQAFDVVVLWHVMEHMRFLERDFKILSGLVKQEGILSLLVPNLNSRAARSAGLGWEWFNPPAHLYYFTPDTITKLLVKHGFQIMQMATISNDSAFQEPTMEEWAMSNPELWVIAKKIR